MMGPDGNTCQRPEHRTNDLLSDREQLHRFAADLAGSDWHASLLYAWAAMVCLRLERRAPPAWGDDQQRLEWCRRTFAEAAACARRYLASLERSVGSDPREPPPRR